MITSVRLIQVGNNRNDYSRYFLGVRVRLITVSFKVNKGNKFGDFGYCPLNRGCPLNTGFTVLLVNGAPGWCQEIRKRHIVKLSHTNTEPVWKL